jgi:hypothetical protein
MAKLILKKFHCIETTSGAGSDSPYFLVFIGGFTPTEAKVKRVRLGPWHDEVDSGEPWPVNHTVIDSDLGLVMCALIEEDGSGPDIGGPFQTLFETVMQGQWKGFIGNQATTVSDFIAEEMRKKFRDSIKSVLGNDDLIQVRRFKVTNGPGELTRRFTGDGGRYDVTFTVE